MWITSKRSKIDSSTVVANSIDDYGIWATVSLAITNNSEVTATGALASLGAGTSVTIEPAINKSIDVYVGGKESSAKLLVGAPFSEKTDLKVLNVADNLYFHSKTHSHIASTTWSTDTANHWHECTANDGEKMDVAPHTFGDWVIDTPATENTVGSKHRDCSECPYVETVTIPVSPHTHTPSTTWSTDASYHWHECTANDGEKMELALHTPGAPATIEHAQNCTVCSYEITPKLPSKKVIIDDTTGTKIEYADGSVFDSNIKLVVTLKPKEEMKNYQNSGDKAIKGMSIGGLYDIKLIKDGVEVQPSGKLKITLILTDTMKSMIDLQIVYIDDNGKVTIISSQLVDGDLVFITDHLGSYGVIGKSTAIKPIDPAKPDNGEQNKPSSPQTGDTSSIVLYFGLIVSSGCLVGYGFKKKKKLSK